MNRAPTLTQLAAVLFTIILIVSPVAPIVAVSTAASAGGVQTHSAGASSSSSLDGPGTQPRMEQQQSSSGPGDKIPVIVVLETQPSDRFNLPQMAEARAQARLQAFAEEEQEQVLEYLRQQKQRGRAESIRSFWVRNVIAVEVTPGVLEDLRQSQDVARVIRDRKVSTLGDDSDSGYDKLVDYYSQFGSLEVEDQGLERSRTGARPYGIEQIEADAVHEYGVIGQGINVSVVDTGINDTHPALQGQVILRKDFTNDSATRLDPDGHGTHVAGTVAAKRTGKQAVGVAPGANLFDARVLNATGSGRLSDIIEGFQWSAENDADVISASLGLDPIADVNQTTVQVAGDRSAVEDFKIYQNATRINGESQFNVSVAGFEPAYVLVAVNVESINGTQVTRDSTAAKKALDNVSLALSNPNGTQSLQAIPTGYMYRDGQVPEDLISYKYKPSTIRKLESGNWSLTVVNSNNESVEVGTTIAPVYPSNGTDELSRSVDNLAATHDVIPVIAAGNSGQFFGNQSVGSPAAAESAITVGATAFETNDVAEFSSRGPVGFDSPRPGVDIIAPGESVLSTYPPDPVRGEEPYRRLSGTSMSTPHVSGAAALVLAANSNLSPTEVENRLTSTAEPVPGGNNTVGAGALDAYSAVNSTVNLPARQRQPTAGVSDLFAGSSLGDDFGISLQRDPVTDPQGDAGNAPDLAATRPGIGSFQNVQLGMHNDTAPNATFKFYVDTDRNDSTGDPSARGLGAELRYDAIREFQNGSYSLRVEPKRYNSTSGNYEPADKFVFDESVTANYIEFDPDLDNTRNFEWHVIAETAGSTDTDRLPDTGQIPSLTQTTVPITAIAWNSTAGEPESGAQIEFRSFSEEGLLLENTTSLTNASGVASEDLQVRGAGFERNVIEIEDGRGNLVTRAVDLESADLREQYISGSTSSSNNKYTIPYTEYVAAPNTTQTIQIPIYSESNGEFVPYEGPVSIRLESFDRPDATYENISVENGVARIDVDFANVSVEDGDDTSPNGAVALGENFSESRVIDSFAFVVNFENPRFETQLAPRGQTVAPGESSDIVFGTRQTGRESDSQKAEPANVSVSYQVRWVKDRFVADILQDLPQETASKLASGAKGSRQVELNDRDRAEIQEAINNVSASGTVDVVQTGVAAPTERGVGTLSLTPPSDTRFGFVRARYNPSNQEVNAGSGFATVFVDSRLSSYQPTMDAPAKTDYELEVDAFWPSVDRNGTRVPEENITVDVRLLEEQNIGTEMMDGATVVLYNNAGESVTVTTNGSREVQTTLPAPDLDYRNASSFEVREQAVLGIARGYQTDRGYAVAEQDTVFGFVEDSGSSGTSEQFFQDAQLEYSGDTLSLQVSFQNDSSQVNGTTTLVRLGRPDDAFGVSDQLLVEFVDASNQTFINRSFNVPLEDDVAAQFEADSQSARAEFGGFARERVSGASVAVDAPRQIGANETATVTLNLTDRNGEAIANAPVVFSYSEAEVDGGVISPITGTQDRVSREFAGNATIGRTNSSGIATFTINPNLRTELGDGFIIYRAGYASQNQTDLSNNFGAIRVEPASEFVNITGTVQTADGSAAAEKLVAARSGGVRPNGEAADSERTASDGSFRLNVSRGTLYDVAFADTTSSGDSLVDGQNGIPDLFALTSVDATSDTALGTTQLPSPSALTIDVVNESGEPVGNATVSVIHRGGNGATAELDGKTDSAGSLGGLELAGNVTLLVEPPATDQYIQQTYRRSVVMNQSRNVTIALSEFGTGDLEFTPADPSANVTDVTFQLTNASYGDRDPATWQWAFGDNETARTNTNTTSHIYDRPGQYTVSVTAVNSSGEPLVTANTQFTVTQAGSGEFTATPTTATVGVDQVAFNLTNVTTDEGVTPAEYVWSFGDNSSTTTPANTSQVTHTYDRPVGTVTPTVSVRDSQGRVLFTEQVSVTVVDDLPPTAVLRVPTPVVEQRPFTANASASTDNFRIANYTFRTDEGQVVTTDSPTANLIFNTTGTHEVSVTVTDAVGNTNTTNQTLEVVTLGDLTADVSAPDTQQLRAGVEANVTIANEGGKNVSEAFEAVVTASTPNASTTQRFSFSGLNAGASETRNVNVTDWAQRNQVTGPVEFNVIVAPNATIDEISTDNNADTDTTEVTFSDLRVTAFAPANVVENETDDIYALVRNAGTAASPANATVTLSVTCDDGASCAQGANVTRQVNLSQVASGDVARESLAYEFKNNVTVTATVEDQLFPAGNRSTQTTDVTPYTLQVDRLRVPSEIGSGNSFIAVATFSQNVPGEVTANLTTPSGLSVADSATKRRYGGDGTTRVAWEVTAADGVRGSKNLSVTVSAYNKSATDTGSVDVVVPKLRVSNQTAAVANGTTSVSRDLVVRNETTYQQEVEVTVQAGARGRTLKGLDYLVEYPYGCVEQTTSPMLGALNTDQYYRNTSIDYDRQKVNRSVAQGVDRLSPGGVDSDNAQHRNGAWSMWGDDPQGDLFYTVYALYGTSQVGTDPVQGERTAVSSNLMNADYNQTINWLAGKQDSDGSFRANYYYEDRRSMTGLTVLAMDRASEYGLNATAQSQFETVQADAAAYLLQEQNADGSWNGDDGTASPMATALAMRGLAAAQDNPQLNSSDVSDALNASEAYLKSAQSSDGSWDGYHDSESYSPEGDTSEATAHSLLALDAAGVENTNATVVAGVGYLTGVYEDDGSWGYTRATAIAIKALEETAQDGAIDQTVTVEIGTQQNPDILNTTVSVSGSGTQVQTVTFSTADSSEADQLQTLRNQSTTTRVVGIDTDGSGTVIVSVDNTQIVNENEYEAATGGE